MPKSPRKSRRARKEARQTKPSALRWETLARDPRLGAALLLVITLIAYIPAFSAGFIWDDPDYVIQNPNLRTLDGLAKIWTEPTMSAQYYPLVYTTFWAEFHAWGLHAPGYHIVNILLHAGASILLWRVLAKLQIPGAWLAAGLFAVHPVHVESVAWITERKNVLSGVFYLAAALAYLKFMDDRSRRAYVAALLLFILALFSKTVTCSLPAAILLVVWWRRGKIVRRDVIPLVPFFVIGFAMAMVTAWMERSHVQAAGTEWSFTFIERCLIAGRAIWFYAVKLVAPFPLVFMYPKWDISAADWRQWVYPLTVVAVVLALWIYHRELGRGPIVAALFFIGTLLPALGFFNVYPMRYSFVADHFQYLASIGILVLIAAGISKVVPPQHRQIGAIVLLPLLVLTFRQAMIYKNAETLWRTTEVRNRKSWMVPTNLAHALVEQGRLDEAARYYERALELEPNLPETHWNVGISLASKKKHGSAIEQFRMALDIDPNFAPAYFEIGNAHLSLNEPDQAAAAFRRAIELNPKYAEAHFNLGFLAEAQNRPDDAITHYRSAIAIRPTYGNANLNLANILIHRGQFAEAAQHYRNALIMNADDAAAHTGLGSCYLNLGEIGRAKDEFEAALRIDPHLEPARRGLDAANRRR
jgi:tetratricopeptide (TPR) repeat protein